MNCFYYTATFFRVCPRALHRVALRSSHRFFLVSCPFWFTASQRAYLLNNSLRYKFTFIYRFLFHISGLFFRIRHVSVCVVKVYMVYSSGTVKISGAFFYSSYISSFFSLFKPRVGIHSCLKGADNIYSKYFLFFTFVANNFDRSSTHLIKIDFSTVASISQMIKWHMDIWINLATTIYSIWHA